MDLDYEDFSSVQTQTELLGVKVDRAEEILKQVQDDKDDIRYDSTGVRNDTFKITKIKFPPKKTKETIIFNDSITIQNIPQKAYDYIVNGKSAIE